MLKRLHYSWAVALLIGAVLPWMSHQQNQYICPATCQPPQCFCASTAIPGGLTLQDTPQFVTLTFDDAVQPATTAAMNPVLAKFTNPNGCPIPAIFFTQVLYTDWSLVQGNYNQGHEIACHTMTHQDLALMGDPGPEIVGSFRTINAFGGVPRSKLRGFRAPFLSFNDQVFNTLSKNGFLYDSSVTLNPLTAPYWPHTLDYGFPYKPEPCEKCGQNMIHPGLWEIPMYNLLTDQDVPFSSMDPTYGTPDADALAYLKHSFDLHYKRKLPFGLYQHIAQFIAYGDEYQTRRIKLLTDFLAYIKSFPDTWFVTNQQLLDWMIAPVPLAKMLDKFPCIPPPQNIKNPEICDGVDNNLNQLVDEGVVEMCQPDPTTSFSSCFGCPVEVPSLQNPVPATGSNRKRVPDPGCPAGYTWDPVAGRCVGLLGGVIIVKQQGVEEVPKTNGPTANQPNGQKTRSDAGQKPEQKSDSRKRDLFGTLNTLSWILTSLAGVLL